MPDTFTANLNLTKPEVGASGDTWGTKQNAAFDIIDAQFNPTGTGTVIRRDASGNAVTQGLTISGVVASTRLLGFLTGTSSRWNIVTNNTAEAGANAGSDFAIVRFSDAAAALGTSLSIERKTGIVTFEATPLVGTNQVYHQGNLPAVIATVSEPLGTIKMYAGPNTADPPGGNYLLCDGRAISRTTFAALFAIINSTYGPGDGVTTFNIPNMSERVPVGQAVVQTQIPQYDARILGNKIGEGNHLTTVAEMPAHNHAITDPGHHHTFTPASSPIGTGGSGNYVPTAGTAFSTSTDPTGITIANVGGGSAHNNVQPALVLNFIIRVQ